MGLLPPLPQQVVFLCLSVCALTLVCVCAHQPVVTVTCAYLLHHACIAHTCHVVLCHAEGLTCDRGFDLG